MSYFVNMKIINNTWIVNFCLTDWFLLEIKGCKRKKWSRLVGTFPFWHHWALTHGPTRVSTHTHIVLFTSAQRVWIFTILNFQYRVMFKVDKMTHSLCDLYLLIWQKTQCYDHSLQSLWYENWETTMKNDK